MRRTYFYCAALACLAFSGDSEAGLFGRRVAWQPAACQGPSCSPQYYPAPVPAGGDFLGRLNAWRASRGRGPVAYDPRLAAAASTNVGQHSAGSSGGGSQCWSPTPDPVASLQMWTASPAHASILLAANAVGFSPCPSGFTCNAL